MKTKKDLLSYNHSPSRRDFVKTAAGAGVAAAAFAMSPWGTIRAWAEETFDYIVVGSGAGGGTVACRLVQAGFRVLLIEAGAKLERDQLTFGTGIRNNQKFPAINPQEPVAHAYASEDPSLAWGFYVNHYKAVGDKGKKSPYTDFDNRLRETELTNPGRPDRHNKVFYPRGASIGGSTAVNAMITLRPDQEDWDEIANITKDDSWKASNSDLSKVCMDRLWEKLSLADTTGNKVNDFENQVLEFTKPWLHRERINPLLVLKDFLPGTGLTLPRVLFAAIGSSLHMKGSTLQRLNTKREVDAIIGDIVKIAEQDLESKIGLGNPAKRDAAARDVVTRLQALYDKIDPDTAEYVADKSEGLIDVPRATLGGRRNGTRDLIERTQSQFPGQLTIESNTLVSQVILDEDKRAIGVMRRPNQAKLYGATIDEIAVAAGEPEMVKATREVILAGGAFNTPQLLMLSGIGDPTVLADAKIPVQVALPGVGKNLQDRYEVTITTKYDRPIFSLKDCLFGEGDNDPCAKAWSKDPSSVLYGTNGVLSYISKKTSVSPRKGRTKSPDLMIFAAGGKFEGYQYQYSHGAGNNQFISWAILKGHTENTAGEVRLKKSADGNQATPFETPYINFNYFQDGNGNFENDRAAVAEGMEFVRSKLRNYGALGPLDRPKKLKGNNWHEELPGGDTARGEQGPALASDTPMPYVDPDAIARRDPKALADREATNKFIEKNAWGHHASCSCKMGARANGDKEKIGRPEDPMAVVDSKFRVFGVNGLRIVDASVFPYIPGLFLVVPTYMVGEKAAEAIVSEARKGENYGTLVKI